MTTAPNPSRYQRWGLLFALALLAGPAGCTHAGTTPHHTALPTGDPCVSMEAVLQGATKSDCTLAQRICLLAGDIPPTIGQQDFVPAASYMARWQPHVKAWLAQLTEIAKDPALESYAVSARQKLEQVGGSERNRRLIVESGDLLYALKMLGQNATKAPPAPGLGCALPE